MSKREEQSSRGAAFDAANQPYEGSVNEKSVKQGVALTPEDRAKARHNEDAEPGAVNRRYKEGLTRQDRFKLSSGGSKKNTIGKVTSIS